MTTAFADQRIAIIGLGLIGGSVARSLRAETDTGCIVGCVADERDAELARELALADHVTTNAPEAVAGADIVILAVGIDAMGTVCRDMRQALGRHAIITDVGSTKGSVIADVTAALGADIAPRFVPGHPISGTEQSGLRAGFNGLFRQHRVILTPNETTDTAAVARVAQLWQTLGADVRCMDAEQHDAILAATSHLPHLLAFALVDTLADMDRKAEIFDYAAGGFADFTRIASSDPDLWTAIMAANHDAIDHGLTQFLERLTHLREALRNQDADIVRQCFERARQARDRFTHDRQTGYDTAGYNKD